LRETFANGTLRNWSYTAADNVLTATAKIAQVPSNGLVTFSQIHSKNSVSPLLMLGYQALANGYGNVVISFRGNPASENSTKILLSSRIKMNQEFSYEVFLAKNGRLTIGLVEPDGTFRSWSGVLNSAWASHGLYFKAGVYTLDNSGNETSAGAAVFSNLQVEHR